VLHRRLRQAGPGGLRGGRWLVLPSGRPGLVLAAQPPGVALRPGLLRPPQGGGAY